MSEKRGKTVTEKKTTSNLPKSGGRNGNESNEAQVVLNVYDLSPVNKYIYWIGFGIFHSGIEVHGSEYAFGAHHFPVSGVFEVEPRNCPGFVFRRSIPLGRTKMPLLEFRRFIESAASDYHGDMYHLISKNCNHFTDDISRRLTGKHIPGWVNRLARLGAVCSCLLPESLQATTVRQPPDYREHAADGNPALPTPVFTMPTRDSNADQEQLLSPVSSCGELAFVSPVSSCGELAFVKEVNKSERNCSE